MPRERNSEQLTNRSQSEIVHVARARLRDDARKLVANIALECRLQLLQPDWDFYPNKIRKTTRFNERTLTNVRPHRGSSRRSEIPAASLTLFDCCRNVTTRQRNLLLSRIRTRVRAREFHDVCMTCVCLQTKLHRRSAREVKGNSNDAHTHTQQAPARGCFENTNANAISKPRRGFRRT